MIDSELLDLFTQDNIDKQAKIEYSGGVMTNTELFQNSEQLTESLCSENELRFGCCEASCFKFKVANIMKPLMGEQIKFSIVVDHKENNPIKIGTYKVQSDTLTADRRHREITAYDAMYDIINADVAAWYNSVLPNENSTMTLKQFREKFIRHFGLTEVLPKGGLVNDGMTVERTIDPEQISGKDVITAICEINACFGHIGRDGKFHYIYLPQAIEGLYPADDLYPDRAPEWMAQAKTGHLYPQDPKSTKIGTGTKIKCEYESFRTRPITRLQIRQEENDIGRIWPDGDIEEKDNCYIIQDNFLVYGKSHEQLGTIAQNIFSKITDIIYRPFNAYCTGNPCFEVGDPVRLTTKYDIIESYILKRTMKGIQALRDTYDAAGVEKYNEKVNGVHKSIIQLKGKANILTRTIEETKLEMYDIEAGLSNTITVTAGEIRGELQNTKDGLENQISITAKGFEADLKNTKDGLENQISATATGLEVDLKNTKKGLEANISATAEEIRTDISATYETKTAASQTRQELSSQITQLPGQIMQIVSEDYQSKSDAKEEYKNLNSSIEQTAKSIRQDVSETYQTKTSAGEEYELLSSSIVQTAQGIRQDVSATYETKTGSESKFKTLQSSFEQTESKIALKVSKGDVSSEISQEAGKIHLEADRLSWDSTYSSMTEDGKFRSSGVEITGGKVEVHGKSAEETRIAVRLSDTFATEISASGINSHMKYLDGVLRKWLSIHPTTSYISSPLTVGMEEGHITYALYVGGTNNTHISNTLELDNPTVISSDKRLKESIKYISDKECFENIQRLKQAEFEYKKNPGITHHGIIAQDAQEEFENGWSPVRNSGDYLGVAYEEIIADLIGAVKYLANEINVLQNGKGD